MVSTPVRPRVARAAAASGGLALACAAVLAPASVATHAGRAQLTAPVQLVAEVSAWHPADLGGGPSGGSDGAPGGDVAPAPAHPRSPGSNGSGSASLGAPAVDVAPHPDRPRSPGGGSDGGAAAASAPAAGVAQDSSGIGAIFQQIESFFGIHPDKPGPAAQSAAAAPEVPAKPVRGAPAAASGSPDQAAQLADPAKKVLPAGVLGQNQDGKIAPTPDTVIRSVLSGVSKVIHSVVH